MVSKCPRCDADSVELGKIQLPIESIKKASVSIKLCGKCTLVYARCKKHSMTFITFALLLLLH